nr:MAG TPA: hypothetical protein [Caudoviricetes sp.]
MNQIRWIEANNKHSLSCFKWESQLLGFPFSIYEL